MNASHTVSLALTAQVLFDANPQPCWVYDVESLTILAVNDAAVAQYGYSRDEFLALTVRDLRPVEDTARLLESVRSSPVGLRRSGPWRHVTKGGATRWVEIASSPLTYQDRPARLVVVNDVTERIEEHRSALAAEARFRALAEYLPAIIVFIDPVPGQPGEWYVSPQIEPILGYTPAEFLSPADFWITILHPDDYDRIVTALAASDAHGTEFNAEFRLRHRDGHYLWFQTHSVLVRDELGAPRYWQGMMQDITGRKHAEVALREAEERFRNLVERLPTITLIEEPGLPGNALYVSPQVETILGYRPDELVGRPNPLLDLVHPDDRARLLEELERTDRTGALFSIDVRLRAKDGHFAWMHNEAVLVRSADGTPRYWQGVLLDITARKEAEAAMQLSEQRFRHQALHDQLTDLANRVLFEDRLDQALHSAARRRNTLAVLFLDLDNFKDVNDSLGHKAGDQLLCIAAQRISEAVRASDTVARFGGDEFTILLDDLASDAEVAAVVERIAHHLTMPMEIGGHRITVSASIGIALAGEPRLTAEEMIRRADVAMYAAKRAGKARHAFFDGEQRHHIPRDA